MKQPNHASPQQLGPDDDLSVGQRLRAVRLAYGLSQRRLGRLGGVSNATISLIEKDRLNPSLGVLLKILAAFPLSLTEFWETVGPAPERVFYRFRELKKIRNNRVTYWQVGDASQASAMIFQYERYEPGMDGGEVQTRNDTEMRGFVIEGKLEVTVGEQRRILGPGDAYRFSGRVPHRLRVVGRAPVLAVSCTVPPAF